jgi:chitodextrinase
MRKIMFLVFLIKFASAMATGSLNGTLNTVKLIPSITLTGTATTGNSITTTQDFSFGVGTLTGTYAAAPAITTDPIINLTSNTVAPGSASQGAKNQILYQVKMDVGSANAKLLSVKFNLNTGTNTLTDIDGGYRLYASNDEVLSTEQDLLLGTVSPVGTKILNFALTQPSLYASGTTRTFFLVTSISPFANVGNQIQVAPILTSDFSFEGGVKTANTNAGKLITITASAPKNFPYPTDILTILACNSKEPSKVISITQSPYNADPTGVRDATSAFKAALATNNSFIYVPNGTYRLIDSIMWNPTPRLVGSTAGRGGDNIIMWGQSKEGVVIKLDNNAAGFNNPNNPKVMVFTGEASPDRFGNSIHNVTFNTGSGNPGAIGLRHYCNNYGGVYNVNIVSGDGAGVIGMDKGYSRANGPSLMKGVTIDGFNVGIRTDFAIESETFEHITLRNQKQIGFHNIKQVLSIRDLRVENCGGPAFVNESGHVVILDSDLKGTGQTAIRNGATAKLLLRNITTSGYTQAILDPDKPTTAQRIIEWTSDNAVSQFGTTGVPTTLNLPIKETPEVPWDDPSTWVNVENFGATPDGSCASPSACFPCDDDGVKIQAAIDATLPGGSKEGATTLYLPANYRVMSTIRIRGSIRRIIGTGKSVAAPYAGINVGGGVTPTNFIVEAGTHPVIVLENIVAGSSTSNGCAGCLGITHFENTSGRTLVFRNATMGSSTFTGGEVYFESVSGSRDGLFTFNNANVWARQFNPERDAAKIIVDGGTFWALGLKTEGHGEIIVAKNNAQVEVFGAYVYSLSDSRNLPMFDLRGSKVAINFFEYNGRFGIPYVDIINEAQQDGTLRILGRGAPATAFPTAPPIIAPTYPATWSQRNDGSTGPIGPNNTDGVVGSNIVLYSNNLVTQVTPDTEAPSIPTTLAANAITQNTFTLNWTASTDNVGVVSYEVFRNEVSVGSTGSTTINVSGLIPSTVYSMTVIAKDAAGNVSKVSVALSVTTLAPDTQAPTVPTGLASSNITNNGFTLSWTASTDNIGVVSYEIFRDGVSVGTTTTATTINITGLTASTAYSMRVVAKDAAANASAQSAVLSVTTLATLDTQAPTVPSGLVSSAITQTGFTLSWTASTDNIGVVSYEIFRDGVSIGTTTTATTINITGLTASTAYNMRVVAKDAAANASAQSTALAVTTLAAPDNQAPTVPMGLVVSSVSPTGFVLSWTASTDNVGVTAYEVFRDGVLLGTTLTTTITLTGLLPGTTYNMSVKAKDAAGNTSAASAVLAASTAVITAVTPTSSSQANLRLFPNPAFTSEEVHVFLEGFGQKPVSLTVTDLLGNLQTVVNMDKRAFIVLKVNTFLSGVYLVSATNGVTKLVQKLVIR